MYNNEIKQEINELFENYSVTEISNMKSISLSTLYRWKKQLNDYIIDSEYDNVKDDIKQSELKDLEIYEKQYSNNIKIQSLIVSRYISFYIYDKAIEICNRYPKEKHIQSQLITIYIKQGKLTEAIEICNKFIKDKTIQSQLVTIYIKQGKLTEAIEICNNFPKDKYTQNQLVSIYITTKQFDKALQICNNFPLDDFFQSQLVKILIENEQFDEAIEICNKFPEHDQMQNQLVSIYIKLGKIKEAAEICKKYPNNKYFQKKLNFVREKEIEISKEILTNIRLRILNDEVNNEDLKNLKTLEEIIDSNIYKFVKIAIYHRLGMIKSALQILKNINLEYNKIKNKLFNMLSNKRLSRFYEITVYDEIINWNDEIIEETNNVKIKK